MASKTMTEARARKALEAVEEAIASHHLTLGSLELAKERLERIIHKERAEAVQANVVKRPS